MQNEPIIHETSHPVEASAGGNNAYYLRTCPIVERGPSYASCLSRLHDIDGGRVNERTAQCDQAVRQNRCIAAGMREQEKLAGTALFYFPRTSKAFLPVKVAGDFGVLITNLTDPALIPAEPRSFGERTVKRPPAPIEAELQVDALAVAINNATATKPSDADFERAANTFGEVIRTPPLPTMEEVRQAIAALPPEEKPVVPPTVMPAAMAAEMVAQMSAGAGPKIQPGETPLQYARRMAALRNKK